MWPQLKLYMWFKLLFLTTGCADITDPLPNVRGTHPFPLGSFSTDKAGVIILVETSPGVSTPQIREVGKVSLRWTREENLCSPLLQHNSSQKCLHMGESPMLLYSLLTICFCLTAVNHDSKFKKQHRVHIFGNFSSIPQFFVKFHTKKNTHLHYQVLTWNCRWCRLIIW